MSEDIALISRLALSKKDLTLFIESIGGIADPKAMGDWRISKDSCHLWLYLSSEDLDVWRQDGFASELIHKLGGEPATIVIVKISRTEGSKELASQFADDFTKQWPSVVDDLHGHTYTRAELLRMMAAGKPFSHF